MNKNLRYGLITILILPLLLTITTKNYCDDVSITFQLEVLDPVLDNVIIWTDINKNNHVGMHYGQGCNTHVEVTGADTVFRTTMKGLLPTGIPGGPIYNGLIESDLNPNETTTINYQFEVEGSFRMYFKAYNDEVKSSNSKEFHFKEYIGFKNASTYGCREDQIEGFRQSLEDIREARDIGFFFSFWEDQYWVVTDAYLNYLGIENQQQRETFKQWILQLKPIFFELIERNGGQYEFKDKFNNQLENVIILPLPPLDDPETPIDEKNIYGRWPPGTPIIFVRVDNNNDPDYNTYNPVVILHELLHMSGLPGFVQYDDILPTQTAVSKGYTVKEDIEMLVGWMASQIIYWYMTEVY